MEIIRLEGVEIIRLEGVEIIRLEGVEIIRLEGVEIIRLEGVEYNGFSVLRAWRTPLCVANASAALRVLVTKCVSA